MAKGTQTSPRRPGYLLLVCPDAQLLRQHAEECAAQWPPASGAWERFCYWGDEEPPRAFWENLSLTGLLGTQRLVLVRQANSWPAAVWHRLSKALSQPLAGNFPIFCLEVGFEKGKFKVPAWLMKLPCWTFADKQGWIWRNEGVTDKNIARFVQDEAARAGVRLSQETLARLCDTLPRSAEVIANEIEKLALACPPGTAATPEHVSTADWIPEARLFDCVDALMRGSEAHVWREFGRIADIEGAAFPLFGILALYCRRLWQLSAGESPPIFGASRSLLPPLARRLGPAGCAFAIAQVVEAELSIKSGKFSVQQAVEFLLSQLLTHFRPGR